MKICAAPAAIVSRACVLCASPRGVCIFWVRHRIATLLYLVKCLLFAIIASAVFITGAEMNNKQCVTVEQSFVSCGKRLTTI